MNTSNLFGFGNVREISQNLAQNCANVYIVMIVFHFLKTFAKFRQNVIKIEHKNAQFPGKIKNLLLSNKNIVEVAKKLDACC